MDVTNTFLTFDEFLRHWAETRGDATAQEQEGRRTSFRELEEKTRRIAGVLADNGVSRGDRISYLGKNSDLYFQLLFASARIGVVVVPIGWRLAPPEMAYILRDTGAKLLVGGEGFEGAANALKGDELPALETVLSEAEVREAIDARTPVPLHELPLAGPDDAALQLYTSGTTGNPKGAVLSQRNFFNLRQFGLAAGLPWSRWEAEEAVLVCMPCAHIGGTGLAVMCFAGGARALIQAEFAPDNVLEAIERGVTRFFIVPAALQMVIQHPKAPDTDFSKLRWVFYGAAPIPLELLREAVRTIPNASFLQMYGMTETSGTIVVLPPEDHDLAGGPRMRSAGKALPGVELKIVDADGNELPRGEVGEVVTRSPNNMLGYWKLPDATRSTVADDGWLRTGDAATMDKDGYIYIQDRIKDMIISGGENVYPAEVESAIYGHPDIAEVAVIGVPDAKWGEAVKACVVPKPGHTVDEAGVIAWARERIAAFKAPKSIDVIPEMPRNPSGKILRRHLRDPYWAGLERQVN